MEKKWFHFDTKRLCILGIMVALKIVLERVLSISMGDYLRISFSFIPVAVTGMLMGPVASTLVAVVADLLGTLISGQAPFPPLTVVAALTGFFYGAFFYRKKVTMLRAAVCFIPVQFLCSLILNSLCLVWMGIIPAAPEAFWIKMTPRIIRAVVQYPINVVLMTVVARAVDRLPASLRHM